MVPDWFELVRVVSSVGHEAHTGTQRAKRLPEGGDEGAAPTTTGETVTFRTRL